MSRVEGEETPGVGGETRVTTTPAKTVLVGVFEVEVVEIICLILDSLILCAQSCESARGYFIAAYASSLHHCLLLFFSALLEHAVFFSFQLLVFQEFQVSPHGKHFSQCFQDQ